MDDHDHDCPSCNTPVDEVEVAKCQLALDAVLPQFDIRVVLTAIGRSVEHCLMTIGDPQHVRVAIETLFSAMGARADVRLGHFVVDDDSCDTSEELPN